MNYLLIEAQKPIQDALERLLGRSEARHPFVIVSKVGCPGVFVRFAGSRERGLIFDVPARNIATPVLTPLDGAMAAVSMLQDMGVLECQRVLVHEEEDRPKTNIGELLRELLT